MGFVADRKEKRWIVWIKDYSGSLYTRSGDPGSYVYSVKAGDYWNNVLETQSFDEAKESLVSYAQTLGLDNIKVTRTVDFETVLYPIS